MAKASRDLERIRGFAERYLNLKEQIAEAKAECAEKCGEIKEDMKGLLEEATREGMDAKALVRVMRARELEKKALACRDGLPGEARLHYDDYYDALSGTPLGKAAADKKAA